MFMVPLMAPDRVPARSMQNAQLGLMVSSAPKVATVKQATAAAGDAMEPTRHSPAAASRNPNAAGSRRDQDR
jgi:hypothetical protein